MKLTDHPTVMEAQVDQEPQVALADLVDQVGLEDQVGLVDQVGLEGQVDQGDQVDQEGQVDLGDQVGLEVPTAQVVSYPALPAHDPKMGMDHPMELVLIKLSYSTEQEVDLEDEGEVLDVAGHHLARVSMAQEEATGAEEDSIRGEGVPTSGEEAEEGFSRGQG